MTYNIRSRGMLGTSHSWAVTMRNILRYIISYKHNVLLDSINGMDMIPSKWLPLFSQKNIRYDLDFCYTIPRNFPSRFLSNSKVKAAIYNYETNILPKEWIDKINHIDYVLPSSQFSKEVFVNNGWPEYKCKVVPLGIDIEDFGNKSIFQLKNKKSFRFLNVSIPHYRKNIFQLIDAYCEAFSKKDDVCLVIKTSLKKPKYRFECNALSEIQAAQSIHPYNKLPQIEVIDNRLPSMVPLYNACDALVSTSSSEGFGIPFLEALAADMLVIAPNCTGQRDFLGEDNAILVDTDVVPAGYKYQYWSPSKGATTFMPKKEDLINKMRMTYYNYKFIKNKTKNSRIKTAKFYTWKKSADKILELI